MLSPTEHKNKFLYKAVITFLVQSTQYMNKEATCARMEVVMGFYRRKSLFTKEKFELYSWITLNCSTRFWVMITTFAFFINAFFFLKCVLLIFLCYAVLIAFESENEGSERGPLDSPLVPIYGHVSRQNGCFCVSCFCLSIRKIFHVVQYHFC